MAKKVEKKVNDELKEEKTPAINIKEYEKELDKYFEEKKNEVSVEITKKVDDQIELKVNKRMKEEEKKYARTQKFKIVRRNLIIIILLAVIGYFGYCLFDIDYFNIRTKVVAPQPYPKDESPTDPNIKDNTPDEPSKPDVPSEPIIDTKPDPSYYIENYGYLIDNLQINDEKIYDLYNQKITSNTISNELKLKIAYKNLPSNSLTTNNNTISFSASALLDSAKKIFGESTTLNMDIFSYNKTKFIYYNDTYLGLNETEEELNFIYEISSAEEIEDKLIFDVLIAKVSPEKALLDKDDKIILENYNNEKLTDLKDSLKSYKITFQNINSNYIFDSCELKIS